MLLFTKVRLILEVSRYLFLNEYVTEAAYKTHNYMIYVQVYL